MANIMIVDDSPIIVQRLRYIFESLGHNVVAEASDGREAIEKYGQYIVDLVTMDIQMPGLDGIETVRLIREMDPEAAIIMVSSVEERSKVFEAIKKGARHYILKPFTEAKVKEVVNAVLGSAAPAGSSASAAGAAPAGSSASAAAAAAPAGSSASAAAVAVPAGSSASSAAAAPSGSAAAPAAAAETSSGSAGELPVSEPGRRTPETFVLKAPEMSALPFELIYAEDRMVLMIQRHVNRHHLRVFHSCLQGLLYFRKLKIVIECWEPVRDEEAFRLLLEFVDTVRSRKGTAAVVSDDPAFHAVLQSNLKTGVYRSVKEIGWLT